MTLEQAFAQLPSIQDRFDGMFTKVQAEAVTTLIDFMVNQTVSRLVLSDVARQNVVVTAGIAKMYASYLANGVPQLEALQLIRDYQYMIFSQRKE